MFSETGTWFFLQRKFKFPYWPNSLVFNTEKGQTPWSIYGMCPPVNWIWISEISDKKIGCHLLKNFYNAIDTRSHYNVPWTSDVVSFEQPGPREGQKL